MTLMELNINEIRFKELETKPLALINCGGDIGNLIKVTKDGSYSCICPISDKVIEVNEKGEVSCDVAIKGRKRCGTIGLEDKGCVYSNNII